MIDMKMAVKKPEWLSDALKNAQKTFQLSLDGVIPESIRGWMITVACLRVLRAVYGDDESTARAMNERVQRHQRELADRHLFFIQDTRSVTGNSATWWADGGHGYTCDLAKAWKVSREEAESICGDRKTDVMWPCNEIEAISQRHVDVQDMREAEEVSEEVGL